MTKLIFKGREFNVIQHSGQPYLTLQDVARALYAKGGAQSDAPFDNGVRQMNTLYRRHADEFRQDMTALVRMQTPGGPQDVRIFSLRGCHLLGMFARTAVAKDFRAWALDVLDEHLNAGKGWQQEFNKAWLEYSSEKAMASLCGKGLNQWRLRKSPMEQRVERLADQAQVQSCLSDFFLAGNELPPSGGFFIPAPRPPGRISRPQGHHPPPLCVAAGGFFRF